jgi:hypothetical protein
VLPDEKYSQTFGIEVRKGQEKGFHNFFLINLIYFFFFIGLPDEKYSQIFGIKIRAGIQVFFFFFIIILTNISNICFLTA